MYALCKLHVIYYYSNICVSCMSYIITLTFGQSSIVEVDPLRRYPCLTLPFGHLLADPMLARPRMSVTQWVQPRQGILIRSILPLFLS